MSGVASRWDCSAVRRRALFALIAAWSERRSLAGWLPVRRWRLPKCLERAVSTVSLEVARHGGRPAYRASQADGEALAVGLCGPSAAFFHPPEVRDIVASKLMLDWSPKQTSGWLKTQYIPMMRACVCPTKPFLPQPVHSSPWSAEKGATGGPAIQASHTPVATHFSYLQRRTRSNPRGHSRSMKAPAEVEDRAIPGALAGRRSPARLSETVTSRPWWNIILRFVIA